MVNLCIYGNRVIFCDGAYLVKQSAKLFGVSNYYRNLISPSNRENLDKSELLYLCTGKQYNIDALAYYDFVCNEEGCIIFYGLPYDSENKEFEGSDYDELLLYVHSNILNGRKYLGTKDGLIYLCSLITDLHFGELSDDYDYVDALQRAFSVSGISSTVDEVIDQIDEQGKVVLLAEVYSKILLNCICDQKLYVNDVCRNIVDELLLHKEYVKEDGYVYEYKKADDLLCAIESGLLNYADVYPVKLKDCKYVVIQFKNKLRASCILSEFNLKRGKVSTSYVKEHGCVSKKCMVSI